MSVQFHLFIQSVWKVECQRFEIELLLCLVHNPVVGWGEDDDVGIVVVQQFRERNDVVGFHAQRTILLANPLASMLVKK